MNKSKKKQLLRFTKGFNTKLEKTVAEDLLLLHMYFFAYVNILIINVITLYQLTQKRRRIVLIYIKRVRN